MHVILVTPRPTKERGELRGCIRMKPVRTDSLSVSLCKDGGAQTERHRIVDLSATGFCLDGGTQLLEQDKGDIRVSCTPVIGGELELASGKFVVMRCWSTGLAIHLPTMSEAWAQDVPKSCPGF